MNLKFNKPIKITIHILVIATIFLYIIGLEIQNKENYSEIKILEFGPTSTKVNTTFNEQENGGAALWFKTTELKNNFPIVIWDKIPLATNNHPGKNLVTASVPNELFSKKGNYDIYILDTKNNIISNKVTFTVYGDTWLGSSWIALMAKKNILEYDKTIYFNNSSNSVQYQTTGWNPPEKDFCWSQGHYSTLVIPIRQPENDISVELSLMPFISPGVINEQNIKIYVNSTQIKSFRLKDPKIEIIKFNVNKNLIKNGIMEIVLNIPTAKSPKELKLNEDIRTLGIALISLRINQITKP